MSIDAQLDVLESKPLLGSEWTTVADALETIRGQLQDASAQTVLRVIVLDAALRMAAPHEDAVPFLSNAERWARGQSLEHGAVQLCLLWCLEVGRVDPGAIPQAVRAKAIAAAQASGDLEVLWRQALAVDSTDNVRLLNEALTMLKAPHHAHTRLQVLIDLTAIHLHGGDVSAAVSHLEAALQLTQAHDAQTEALRVVSMLGQLRLTQGMHDRAMPLLAEALALAVKLKDPLAAVTQASLLCGLQLCAQDWAGAQTSATTQIDAALARGNWLAVADAQISLSTCALALGDPSAAITRLVSADAQMHGHAPLAAMNLVRARLAELRFQLGAEQFDPLLKAAKQG